MKERSNKIRFCESLLVLALIANVASCKSQEKDQQNESLVEHKANEHMHKKPFQNLSKCLIAKAAMNEET